jgi:hypothetical protein
MTVTGGDAPSEEPRVDREPPEFPRVTGTGNPAAETRIDQLSAPLFSRPADSTQIDEPPPVTVPVATRHEPARWRWAAALVATLLVFVVIGAIFFLAGPGAGTPSTSSLYAPADTATFLELRRDLPGDQRDRLAAFMGPFPGFADPAAFEQKLDESLDQILETSGSGLDWEADVEPWFGGQVALFSSTFTPSEGTPPSLTFVLTVKDRSRLDALIEERLGDAEVSQEGHQGQTIWTFTGGPDNQRLSYAVTDEVLLIGLRVEDVKQALDVRADRTTGLADDQFFLEQLGKLHADRLATLYFDGRGIANAMRDEIGDALPPGTSLESLLEGVAIRVLGELRAEGDHIALTTRSEQPPVADLPPPAANKTTDLAESVSAETIFYLESRQVGQGIGYVIDHLLSTIETSGAPVELSGIEQLLGTSPRDFFDFLQDVAVAVAYDDDGLEAGIIATVDDEAVAAQRVERLLQTFRSFAAFGSGITIEEQQHGAATITVIRLSGLVGDDAPVSSLALTVSGGRLYLGLDEFVVNALDRSADSSLASRAEFIASLQAGGTSNAGVMFLDIAALRGLAEQHLVPERDRTEYEQEYKPFIEPLSHLAVVSTTDGEITVSHVFLYVE